MTLVWISATGLLLGKIMLCSYCLSLTTKLLSDHKTPPKSTRISLQHPCPDVFIIIPLLREQERVVTLIDEFLKHSNPDLPFKLVLVTTFRETQDNFGKYEGTTAEAVSKSCDMLSKADRSRIIHIHYPRRNRVVAEQLNHAVNLLDIPQRNSYFCFYNADGQKGKASYDAIATAAFSNGPVFQQSSLFVRNIAELLSKRHFLEAAFGLYQSGWTVQHEISRYTFSRKFVKWLPKWIDNLTLAHCVMHGLLIRSDVLRECRGIPDLSMGGEDIALGFVLRCRGYHINPMPVLENSETPESLRSLWTQLSWWFVALTGYATFDRLLVDDLPRSRIIAQKALGLWDMSKWLLKGGIIILYLYLSATSNHACLGLSLYLLYACLPLVYILRLWKNSPSSVFPRPNTLQLFPAIIAFPIVPILRSGPAVSGLALLFRLKAGFIFEKPKTE